MDTNALPGTDSVATDLGRIVDVLSRVPLFSGFAPAALEALARACVETHHGKGDVVFREGDAGETFYVIAGGEFEVWSGGDPGEIVSRLGPGEVVGEMSFLLGRPRTATVIASRPATLLALRKEAFDRFIATNPTSLEHLSRMLCKRLFATSRHRVETRALTTIGVVSAPGLKGKTFVSGVLAALLAELTGRQVLQLTIDCEPRRRRERAGGNAAPLLEELADAAEERVTRLVPDENREPVLLTLAARPSDDHQRHAGNMTALFARLEARFGFVVVDAAGGGEGMTRAITEACDRVVVIDAMPAPESAADAEDDDARPLRVIDLVNPAAASFPISHCEPFVIPFDATLAALDPRAQPSCIRDDPWSPVARPLYRLARKILGTTVGVALGGGAAFGLAHVGVLQALEEGGIFTDLVAGTSMGSIIGLAYATGTRAAALADAVRSIGTTWTTISGLDFTFGRPGILAGDRFVKILSPLLGTARTFDDLRMPCRTVATDIESGARIIIGSGRLDEAFRASCSVPVLLTPVRREGRVLVDGAISDPVPAEVVRQMGADNCIAVHVVPPLRSDVPTVLSRLSRTLNVLNPFAYFGRSRGLPNMLDLVMNSLQTLQHELGKFKAISADVSVHPDLSDFTWIEFYRPEELIERGRAAGERAVPEIRKVLEAKLARFTTPRRAGDTAAGSVRHARRDAATVDLRS